MSRTVADLVREAVRECGISPALCSKRTKPMTGVIARDAECAAHSALSRRA